MEKKNLPSFNVLLWWKGQNGPKPYDVVPYFVECYEECIKESKKKNHPDYFNVPTDFNSFKKFVKDRGMYHYWARCEYEMVILPWPYKIETYVENQPGEKIDVWRQIEMNIDILVNLLMSILIKK